MAHYPTPAEAQEGPNRPEKVSRPAPYLQDLRASTINCTPRCPQQLIHVSGPHVTAKLVRQSVVQFDVGHEWAILGRDEPAQIFKRLHPIRFTITHDTQPLVENFDISEPFVQVIEL